MKDKVYLRIPYREKSQEVNIFKPDIN